MASSDKPNAIDVAEGMYVYLSEYHEGQDSPEYAQLSRLLKRFNPRNSLRNAKDLNLHGRQVYARMVDKHEGGLTMHVSIYGDGALLDATLEGDYGNLKHDDEPRRNEDGEPDEDGELEPTAVIELKGVPTLVALAAIDYCRHQNLGPQPYFDGYQAMECITTAKESKVISCGVSEYWPPEECDRLGGCFLCGGDHRNLDE